MNRKILLYVAAFLSFLFALLHLAFWEMFNWSEELKSVTIATAGILQIFNIASIYMLIYFASITVYIALKNKSDMMTNFILIFVAGYFVIRVITGYFYFGISVTEIIIWLVCLITAALYILPIFIKDSTAVTGQNPQ